jgi:DDE superfamily endonuclease/Homeodomain-like domain
MSQNTILEIIVEQQGWMLKELRRSRYGYLLALHILLLVAKGKTPSPIGDFLFCSRSSVYRAIAAWRRGKLQEQWWSIRPEPEGDRTAPVRSLQRTLLWVIKQPPSLFGLCRTGWSCAALALTIAMRMGITYSLETIRRELLAAQIRAVIEQLQPSEALFWVDELDIHLLAKVGYQWMPEGTQSEIPTPDRCARLSDWANSLCHREKQNNLLFQQLHAVLDKLCGPKVKRIFIVADNRKIHKAKSVERWLALHPRFKVLWLPTYCPQANPIERAFGDVHDKCTRNHTRKSLHWLIWDVKNHFLRNGPWEYKVPEIYYEFEVEIELTKLRQDEALGLVT